MRQSIIILGAGLLGRLLAYSLAKKNYQVAVFEKSPLEHQQSAAYAAAAMLAPLAESVSCELPIVHMGFYSLTRWPTIIEELDSNIFFQHNGSLIIWHQQDTSVARHFHAQLHQIEQHLDQQYARSVHLDTLALKNLEPNLSPAFGEGIYLPNEGQLDNRALLDSLLKKGLELGVTYNWQSPKKPSDFPTNSHTWILDCRGLGSRPQWQALRGVRGEVIRVFAPEVQLQRPTRLMHPKYPIYIAPKKDHIYVIGATEIESEDQSAISVRSTLELLSAAYTIHSGFAEARMLEANAQCRPTLANNSPAIQYLNDQTLQINGLYRHGYLIAPAIVDATMELIETGTSHTARHLAIQIQENHANID